MNEIERQLGELKIVPVIVIEDDDRAAALARALLQGGLPCAEITFRTAAAARALERMASAEAALLVGAGTILSVQQVASAVSAGARFIVSPGFSPAVVDYCLEQGVPVFPGVCTPTEIEMALAKGLQVVKFFPAGPMGGVSYLKAMAAPYGMMQFIPTGGVNTGNIGEYLALKSVLACGGSWMAPAEWIASGQFDRIAAETARAVDTVKGMGPAK